MTNWKTHRSTTLHFQKGVNVLIGLMGAGKSSVMDAISFALFGTFPALNSKRISLSNIITSMPVQSENAEVKLEFKLGDDTYVVRRRIGNGGSSSTLEKNGEYLQSQPSKVTEEIEAQLKLDYDTFCRAIYAEQNRLDYFLELSKGERKKDIDRMLGLDQFAMAEENVTSLINSLKSMVQSEEDALSNFDIDALKEQLKSMSEERKRLFGEQEAIERQAKEISEKIHDASSRLEKMKSELQRKRKLEEEAKVRESRISTLRTEVEKLKSITESEEELSAQVEKLRAEMEKNVKDLKELQRTHSDITRRHAQAESAKRQCERKKIEKEKLLSDIGSNKQDQIRNALADETKRLDELIKKHAELKAKRGEAEEWIGELRKHVSKCPVCERDMDEKMRISLLTAREQMSEKLKNEYEVASKSVREKESEVKKLRELEAKVSLSFAKLEDYKNIDKELSEGVAELERRSEELKSTEIRMKEKEKETERSKSVFDAAREKHEKAKRKGAYDKDISLAKAELERFKEQAAAIKADDKSVDSMQSVLMAHNSALSDIMAKIAGNAKYLSKMDSDIEDRAKQIANFDAVKERIVKRRNLAANLSKFKAALVDTEASLRNRLVGSVNGLLQGIWPNIYPYGDYPALRLSAGKDDYLLEAQVGSGEWMSIETIASGGERSVASLAMRIALAMVIVPNLKWLILDEPTHNLDAAGISKLIDVLGNTLPEVVEQIFIITHDEELKQISSARIYQLDRDKSVNAPTTVNEL
jgi:exonuclease SbcC